MHQKEAELEEGGRKRKEGITSPMGGKDRGLLGSIGVGSSSGVGASNVGASGIGASGVGASGVESKGMSNDTCKSALKKMAAVDIEMVALEGGVKRKLAFGEDLEDIETGKENSGGGGGGGGDEVGGGDGIGVGVGVGGGGDTGGGVGFTIGDSVGGIGVDVGIGGGVGGGVGVGVGGGVVGGVRVVVDSVSSTNSAGDGVIDITSSPKSRQVVVVPEQNTSFPSPNILNSSPEKSLVKQSEIDQSPNSKDLNDLSLSVDNKDAFILEVCKDFCVIYMFYNINK